jgi:hypothetical protein
MTLRRWVSLALALWAAVVLVAQPAEALTRSQMVVLFGGPPSWVLKGAAYDLNFATGQYYGASLFQIACSRASAAMAQDAQGNWHSFAANVPAITNLGIWAWEGRTNSIRNNTMVGAVAGSPGTGPTNWILNNGAQGLTISVAAVTTSQGLPAIALNVAGTTTGNGNVPFSFDNSTAIAATTGQVWAESVFASIIAGSLAGVSSVTLGIEERNSSGTAVVSNLSAPITLTASPTRFTLAALLNGGATTAFARPDFIFNYSTGAVINFTVLFAAPQLELNPSATTAAQGFATSPILTSGSAQARAADVITMPVRAGMISLLGIGTPQSPAGYPATRALAEADDGTANNRIFLDQISGTNGPNGGKSTGGVSTNATAAGAFVQGTPGKLAALATPTAAQAVFNNGSVATGPALAGLPTISNLSIGNRTGSEQWNGVISRVAAAQAVSLLND